MSAVKFKIGDKVALLEDRPYLDDLEAEKEIYLNAPMCPTGTEGEIEDTDGTFYTVLVPKGKVLTMDFEMRKI